MQIQLTHISTRRTLNWKGRLLVFSLFTVSLFLLFKSIYPFLAPTNTPHAGIMVIEGWIQDYALEEAVQIYRDGNYEKIAATGVQIETGQYLSDWNTYSEMTTARLIELGIPKEEIITANGIEAQKDRTYVAALTLKKYLSEHNIAGKKLHLISVGPHGRRSWLLFKQAFGEEYQIGISSLDNQTYNKDTWWKSSNGFRAVVNELIAYLYAKIFFKS